MEIFSPFGIEFGNFSRIFANVGHDLHSSAVGIRPRSPAGILVDGNKFIGNILIRRNTDHSPHTLSVHGKALTAGIGHDDEDIVRHIAEFFEEFAAFVLFTTIIEIGDVRDEDDILILTFDDVF